MEDDADSHPLHSVAKDLKCKECSSILCSISPCGLLTLMRKEGPACDICRSFEALHAAMLSTDEEFKKVEHRRADFGGRMSAVEAQRTAHKEFANFLDQATEEGPSQELERKGTPTHGEKRPRSSTSPQSPPHMSKRRRLERVAFDESVMFLDESEQRDSEYYQRGTEKYSPGRNAAPEGTEYLDTSGFPQEYKDFHRLRWSKRKWVDLPDSEDEKDDNPANNHEQSDPAQAMTIETISSSPRASLETHPTRAQATDGADITVTEQTTATGILDSSASGGPEVSVDNTGTAKEKAIMDNKQIVVIRDAAAVKCAGEERT